MRVALLSGILFAGSLLTLPAARAQTGNSPAARVGPTKSLTYILGQFKRTTGFTVLCPTSMSVQTAPIPGEPATPESLEAQLDTLVKSLPKGTIWAKLLLPPPAPGRQFKGDDLAAYALAQARLFGTVGGAETGTVEVLSKKLSPEVAAPVVQTLGLQPVYVLCNPNATAGTGDFSTMSDTDKQAWAERQAQQLLTLPPEQQMQAMGQMFQQAGLVFGNLMKTMSPEQRRGLFQNLGSMMGSFGGSGGPFGPGGIR